MKYVDEFRDKKLIDKFCLAIKKIIPDRQVNIMEVCGTHTANFCKFGLDKLLPQNLKLIAGPGCPVCVSSQSYIDNSIGLAKNKDVIILTFGDMLRVPGEFSTLEEARAEYGNIRVTYSPFDCLEVARKNPGKRVVFLAVGFETTAPTIASTIILAKKEKLSNLFFYSSLKLIPPVMKHLLQDKMLKLNGFLCPGHVSAVIGTNAYEFMAKKYKIACCVAGFEPLDIIEGLYLLARQLVNKDFSVMNEYSRVVKEKGNIKARKIIDKVFKASDAYWRGLGNVPGSGLKIRQDFMQFDAKKEFSIVEREKRAASKLKRCGCGDVLKGIISPSACSLFSIACSPDNPVGPCMVSSEGACNAYYRYRR